MHMFGHEDKGVNLKSTFAAIAVERLKEEADIVLDHEESSSLPSRESYEVGSGRGKEASRLQERTSAAKAAIFA